MLKWSFRGKFGIGPRHTFFLSGKMYLAVSPRSVKSCGFCATSTWHEHARRKGKFSTSRYRRQGAKANLKDQTHDFKTHTHQCKQTQFQCASRD